MIGVGESNTGGFCCGVDFEVSIAGQAGSQRGVVGHAGRHTRCVSSTLYRLVGIRIHTLPTEDGIAIRATETVVGRGSVGADKAASCGGVEARAARGHIHTLPVISEVLVGAARFLEDALAVDDAVV